MRRSLLFGISLLVATSVSAGDLYLLQGRAIGGPIDWCNVYRWDGDILFHNSTASEAIVRLLDVSNGSPAPSTDPQLVVAPGRTTSVNAQGQSWYPASIPPLWVTHLDVPDGVVVESRIEIGSESCALAPPSAIPSLGKTSFPVFRSLQPANVPKIHLGTDLAGLDARNNVAVYNASSRPATATIEVYAGCNDQLLTSRQIVVPANTVTQLTGFSTKTDCAGFSGPTRMWVTYVSVVVDQPSLSWVSSLANGKVVNTTYGVTYSSP